jgi:hypothetical protein
MALSRELVRLGRAAGSAAPPGAQPPALAPHGLPDQVAVLAADLVDALGRASADPGTDPARQTRLCADARRAVAAARADLDGDGFGFTAGRGR